MRSYANPRRLSSLALFFVLLSLAASLLAPVLLQRRIDRIRAQVDNAADPARTLVTGIQFALAREMSALRGYVITGDSAFLGVYADASEQERQAYLRLEPLVRGLDSRVLERFVVLRTLSQRWHVEVPPEEVFRDRAATPRALGRIPMEQELYEDALTAARDLDDAILAATRTRAHQIRAIERQRLVLTGGLVFLAFVSSLAVAWLGRQVSRLAAEAERQRATAVRALADTRRTLASRDRLMRGVTHDIKNPLGAADGYGELLQMGLHGELAPQQAHAVARIRGCIADALAMIRDLLDLSSAESGTLPVERRATELSTLLRETADEYHAAARAAGRALQVRVADGIPVHTDPARVRQILGNLVSNAIKYARDSDRIVLSAGRAEHGPGAGEWAVLRVEDFGPGIPPAGMARLFEEFYRAEGDDGVEGHGLGLAIARRVARLLGGDLTAESEVGRGSVFSLWLPLRAGREGAPAPVAEDAGRTAIPPGA
ncbi:MAG TPA: ATP-binding protein [Longimicrobium sp.]|nr:ATP-binding protein [Longimicrobium sp.]